MSDLAWKKLSEAVELVIDNRGRNPKSYATQGIPVVDNYLITSDGEANLGGVNRYIDEGTYNSFLRKYIVEGDVLMTLVGNGYGNVATPPRERCAIIQNTIGLRCNKDNSNQFLYYLLKNNRESLMNLNRGAAQPSIKVGDVLNLEFGFPPIDKQNRIASILRFIDKKIELNRQMNQTLEAITQAMFKSWFVDFEPVKAKIIMREKGGGALAQSLAAQAVIAGRMTLEQLENMQAKGSELAAALQPLISKGFEQAGLDDWQPKQLEPLAKLFPNTQTDSELGRTPEGWGVKSLSQMVELIGGGTPKKSEATYWNGDISWFSIKDAPNDGDVFVINTCEKITALGLSKSSTKLLPEGATIISARGTVGRLALVGNPMAMNQSCYGVVGINNVGPCLNYFHIKEAVAVLKQNTHGAVFDTITKDTFDTVKLVESSPELKVVFEELVQPLFDKIKNHLCENNNMSYLRNALLPKLLSGELSVNANQVVRAIEQ